MKLHGIHHITAIATDPQRNLDFYTRVLGFRLVKRTVNFDDPSTYHFYFGDRIGRPGTIFTFFPWPNARRGRVGTGQVTTTSYAVPRGSLEAWEHRLREHGVAQVESGRRFKDSFIRFADPDGLLLELIEADAADAEAWEKSPVPGEISLGRFHVPSLASEDPEATERFLVDSLGFEKTAEEPGRVRLSVSGTSPDEQVDLLALRDGPRGDVAAGTVHHIAFRATDGTEQDTWHSRLYEAGIHVTPVIDRQYFHSIYFREPGGILFEIATDSPGFATDEPIEHLGEALKLPPQYEQYRRSIEEALPPISLSHQGP